MAAMFASVILLSGIVLGSHSGSRPDINPTSRPDIGATSTTSGTTSTTSNVFKSTTQNAGRWGKTTTTSFLERPNRRTTPHNIDRKNETPARDDRSDSYQRDDSTNEGVAPYTLVLFAVLAFACLLYCYHKGKLPSRSSPGAAQEVDSSGNAGVDSPVCLSAEWPVVPEVGIVVPGVGSVPLLRATRYNNDIPPSYESIIHADDSLPSYDDAVAMSHSGGRVQVQLSAFYINGDVPHQSPPRDQAAPIDMSTTRGQSSASV